MRISTNTVFVDLNGTDAPEITWTVYNPQDHWNRDELVGLPKGTILIQLAEDGIDCMDSEIVAIWYKRDSRGDVYGNNGYRDWGLMFSMPASGTGAPNAADQYLCALPVGSVYVQRTAPDCIGQLYLKVRNECGIGDCDDWTPILLTVTRTGTEFSYDEETYTLNLPVSGTLTETATGFTWRPDDGSDPIDIAIPTIDFSDGDDYFTYNPNDGSDPVTVPLGTSPTIPADISSIERPWVKVGEAEATNEDAVESDDAIWHTGKMVRGASAIGTSNADAELRGNTAFGKGNHTMTGAQNSVVGGDGCQVINTENSFVYGGVNNVADGTANPATHLNMFIGGGANNRVEAPNNGIGAGTSNTNTSNTGFIGGGSGNDLAAGNSHFIGAGTSNSIAATNGSAAIGGGSGNQIGANGSDGFIGAGRFNQVNEEVGVALGIKAMVSHDYAIVFCTDDDGNPNAAGGEFASAAAKEFAVKAIGGVRMITNNAESTGMYLSAGGSTWTAVSDRNAKENLDPVDNEEILAAFGELEIFRFNYKGQKDRVDVGPTAQDFYALFGEWCDTRKLPDGTLTIDDSAKIAMLMAAMADASRQIAVLIERIADLEDEVGLLS